MKFLADECVDRQIVDRLRHDGHTVLCVTEMEPGISDQEVLNLVNHRTKGSAYTKELPRMLDQLRSKILQHFQD